MEEDSGVLGVLSGQRFEMQDRLFVLLGFDQVLPGVEGALVDM